MTTRAEMMNLALKRFLAEKDHTVNFVVDNTETLLRRLEDSQLDFAVIEGIFDKRKFGCRLYRKEAYVGICSRSHPFAGRTVSLEDVFSQTIVLREPGSGTRRLLEQAIRDRGYSLDAFARCISVSNFSVIADLVSDGEAITFGYAPVASGREELAVFSVADMQIVGEFNLVYIDEESAAEKIRLFFGKPEEENGSEKFLEKSEKKLLTNFASRVIMFKR